MKKEFIGFYNPTKDETDKSWNEGIFCFDANSILNLYRYSEETRNDFISALNSIKERVFLPYQAAFEFHNNRLSVISSTKSAYKKIEETYKENFEVQITKLLNGFKRHPALDLDSIKKINDDFLSKISKELEKQEENHPDFDSDDSILYSITELFENRIGRDLSKAELTKIYEDGEKRYNDKIPPGYMDLAEKKDKGKRNIYGDLIIWNELIEYTKKEKKPIIFVTDDRKEDWWTIEKGKTIRPREQLIKEFYDLTGIRILIYNADSFLHFAKERKLITEIKDESLREIKEIRVSDEKTNSMTEFKNSFSKITSYRNKLYRNSLNTINMENRLSDSERKKIHDLIARNLDQIIKSNNLISSQEEEEEEEEEEN